MINKYDKLKNVIRVLGLRPPKAPEVPVLWRHKADCFKMPRKQPKKDDRHSMGESGLRNCRRRSRKWLGFFGFAEHDLVTARVPKGRLPHLQCNPSPDIFHYLPLLSARTKWWSAPVLIPNWSPAVPSWSCFCRSMARKWRSRAKALRPGEC